MVVLICFQTATNAYCGTAFMVIAVVTTPPVSTHVAPTTVSAYLATDTTPLTPVQVSLTTFSRENQLVVLYSNVS